MFHPTFFANLLQSDGVKEVIGQILIPSNVAVSGLVYWRIQQLEKQVSKMDDRMYNLLGEHWKPRKEDKISD